MKTIKILGSGCANCVKLEQNVKTALKELETTAEVEKVTDIADIMAYGVLGTPWLVVDEKLVSSGKLLDVDEIIYLLDWWEEESCCWHCCGNC